MVRSSLAALAWVAAVAASGTCPACSSPAAPAAQGGACLQTTDCAQGLVCVPQKDGSRSCTNDLSSAVSTEEAGTKPVLDAAAGDGMAPDGGAATPRDGGGAGMPDASGTAAEAQAPVSEASAAD